MQYKESGLARSCSDSGSGVANAGTEDHGGEPRAAELCKAGVEILVLVD